MALIEAVAAPRAEPVVRDRVVIGSFMAGHFTHHVTNALLTPLLPMIRDSFGLSYAQTGWLVSGFSVSQGLSQAPIGAMADRMGSRAVVSIGLIVTGLVCFLIGLANDFAVLLALLILLGIVAGTYHAPAAALIAQVFSSDRRGAALGWHTLGGNFSFLATPLVAGGLTAATLTWRTPYLVFAFAPIIAGVLLMFALPATTERSRGGNPFQMFREVAGVFRIVGPLLTVAVVFQMVVAAITAFLALYLVDVHKFDGSTAAMIIATPYLAGMAGSPLGGILSDRIGRKPVIVGTLACTGPLLLLLLTIVPSFLLIPVMALMGLAGSMRMPVIEGLLLDKAPVERRASTLGAYYLAAQELGGFAAPGLGLVAGLFGIGQAFVAVGAVAAVASVGVLALHRKL